MGRAMESIFDRPNHIFERLALVFESRWPLKIIPALLHDYFVNHFLFYSLNTDYRIFVNISSNLPLDATLVLQFVF